MTPQKHHLFKKEYSRMDHLLNLSCTLETLSETNDGGIATSVWTPVEGNFKCRIKKNSNKFYDQTQGKLIFLAEDQYTIFLSKAANDLLKKDDRIVVGDKNYIVLASEPKYDSTSIHHVEVLAFIRS